MSDTPPPPTAKRTPPRGAKLLRAFCAARGLRHADLAARLHPPVSARTIGRWLAGTRTPSPAYAAELQQLTDDAVPAESWLPPGLAAWLAAHPTPVVEDACPEVQ